MNNIVDLKNLTEEFFAKHWDIKSLIQPPVWSEKWSFVGEVPNNMSKGCYAWIKEEKVIYIGLALNSGATGYVDHGLGTRISKYWVKRIIPGEDPKLKYYEPSDQIKHSKLDSIITLAFDNNISENQNYLAASLEYFLIKNLKPSFNKNYKN